MNTNHDPTWIRSPWLDELSDEMASILSDTLHALALSCEEHYCQALRRYYQHKHSQRNDPQRPWTRKRCEPNAKLSHAQHTLRTAAFTARQLDMFQPEIAWGDEL